MGNKDVKLIEKMRNQPNGINPKDAEKILATIGQNENACGKIENTKNIDPTIVNGTAAIPAAVIARTTLN